MTVFPDGTMVGVVFGVGMSPYRDQNGNNTVGLNAQIGRKSDTECSSENLCHDRHDQDPPSTRPKRTPQNWPKSKALEPRGFDVPQIPATHLLDVEMAEFRWRMMLR